MDIKEKINFIDGLVPVISVDKETKKVLILAYANEEAIQKTLDTGYAHYYSRSRNKIWMKGEESGNTQKIIDIIVDCDQDAVLYIVEQTGAACHTGQKSCFFTSILSDKEISKPEIDPKTMYKRTHLAQVFEEVFETLGQRKKFLPDDSYSAKLFKGSESKTSIDMILEKLNEETGELLLAAKNNNKENTIEEITDVLFHILILMQKQSISLDDIASEFSKRKK